MNTVPSHKAAFATVISTLFFFLFLCTAQMALADPPTLREQYMDKDGNMYDNKYFEHPQLARLFLSFARNNELPADNFTLQITMENPFTSCAKLSDIGYSTEQFDTLMEIEIENFFVDLRDAPRRPHYECHTGYQSPSAKIVFNRSMLENGRVKKMRFKSGELQNVYEVVMTENRIQLLPDEFEAVPLMYFKRREISGVVNALTYWFYPENTVILYVPAPGDAKDEVLDAKIEKIAAKHNLTPLSTILSDFKKPVTTPYMYYYVDESGLLAKKITEDGAGYLDKVDVDTIIYELEGDVPALRSIDVYARKPGMYE